MIAVGVFLILFSYVGFRLKENEDQYEMLMKDIEIELENYYNNKIFHAPLSKKYGSRFIISLILFIMGVILLVVGYHNIYID